jgi:uncharacterized membrane protein
MGSDFWLVVRFWGTLFLVGAAAYPLTKRLFGGWPASNATRSDAGWHDHGYLFTKAVGLATVTFLVYLAGMTHILPFTVGTVVVSLVIVFLSGLLVHVRKEDKSPHRRRGDWRVMLVEEVFFFAALLLWSWVKGHESSIHGLEKYMDFGFTQSILNSRFFPAPDMWYSGLTINYYYFGHTVLAVLTKFSGIDLAYTFNLMLATLFAFTFTMSFSIGVELLQRKNIGKIGVIGGGVLTAFLVTLAGNMQTIYAFTRGYTGENVKPFWELAWKLQEGGLWDKLLEGTNRYWYANATRFIPFTIHEFPSYSFVVSDVHGHVLSLPFVLLAIALLIRLFGTKESSDGRKDHWMTMVFYGFLCAVLLMTNALDGPIYLGLFIVLFVIADWTRMTSLDYWRREGLLLPLVVLVTLLTSLPFLSRFTSFVSGVAVNCPPAFLANVKVGPILFEGVEKCQHSPLWMMWLLWGFFWFCGVALMLLKWRKKITGSERVLLVFFVVSLALIIFPEFFYFKDIYPAHFRSNTMFKLGYQAFIMWSIVSGYTIVQYVTKTPRRIKTIFLILLIPQLFLVSIFPLFSVRSYFGSLRAYEGLYGLTWFQLKYPDDWGAIQYLNHESGIMNTDKNKSQNSQFSIQYSSPVIVEADGDSYTDYARVSAFTGLPTVIGWPVHEWLWRGSYDVVAPRREVVRKIYESTDLEETRQLLMSYQVRYIMIGSLERQKYPHLAEWKFPLVAREVFRQEETKVYAIDNKGKP